MRRMRSLVSHTYGTRFGHVAAGTLGMILLLGALLPALSTIAPVANAGKPAPPATTVLPNARYAVTWIDSPLVGAGRIVKLKGINDYGIVIGNDHYGTQVHPYATGFYSVAGSTFELNAQNHLWYDLELQMAVPVTGWLVEFAYGINEAADIVGAAFNINPNVPVRAFILENALENPLGPNPPRFLLLPTIGAVEHFATSINNHRDVVGVSGDWVIRYQRNSVAWPYYTPILEPIPRGEPDINDAGVVVSGAYRQLASGTSPTFFSGYNLRKVSNGFPALAIPAMIGGSRAATSGKTGQAGGAIRLPVWGAASDMQLVYSGANWHSGNINNNGDLCIVVGQFSNPGTGYLYYDPDSIPTTANPYGVNGNGILPLNNLVVTQDPDWLNKTSITLSGINDRDTTGLGQICGTAYYSGQGPRSFVLTPFVPTP